MSPPILPVCDDALGAPQKPLCRAQERVWLFEQQHPSEPVYEGYFGLCMEGLLDVAALQVALQAVVARHEALRTLFVERDGRVYQRVLAAPDADFALPVTSEPAAPDQTDTPTVLLRRFVTEQSRSPWQLGVSLPVRARLVRIDDLHHMLLVRLHHIVGDAWSANVFKRDLAKIYAQLVSGKGPHLPALASGYSDYAAWESAYLASEGAQCSRTYWRTQLASLPSLQLPVDRSRGAVRSTRGGMVDLSIPQQLVAGLDRLAREEGCTRFVVLESAWAALLHRISGQADFAIGTFSASRDRDELKDLIGYFSSTLVLRCRMTPELRFRELVRAQREVVREALANKHLPYDEVVRLTGATTAGQLDPLIQAAFMYKNLPHAPIDVPNMSWTEVDLCPDSSNPEVAKFDLTLFLARSSAGVSGTISYSADLFDRDRIERLAASFLQILHSCVVDPDQRIHDLTLLTPTDREQLARIANPTPPVYPVAPLTERFAAQAKRRGDAVAILCRDKSLTYAALDRDSDLLAHRLQELGVGIESRVGVCLPRSLDLVVALLGVLKAGAAYVPLDPAYPEERLRYMSDDAGAEVIVTERTSAERCQQLGKQLVFVEDLCSDPAVARVLPAHVALQPHHLAYVLYTSGSTGNPKGVQVSHANIARLFSATDAWFHFDSDDVFTLFHSYAFDFSVWELWGALLYGGRLVVVTHQESRDPDAFYDLLVRERVTVLNQTPSAFRQLLRVDAAAPRPLALRYVIFGGEALDPTSLRDWFARHGDCQPQLVNMYGITETTVHVTYRPLRMRDAERPTSLIGQPIPDLQLYVLDAYQQPVPVGVPGELYVAGAGVARGYLGRPELTRERFLQRASIGALPTCGVGCETLYRTGDLVRLLPSGDIEYLGRVDSQIKIRGFRIELGEIEQTLASCQGVREAAALVRDGADGQRQIVACYVSSSPALTPTALREQLRQRLPDYMIPAVLLALDALPLNQNGKVDRKALLDRSLRSAPLQPPQREYVAPRTPQEEALCNIWEDTLGCGPVSVHDSFFDLGGDSILSLSVLARARQAGLSISVQQLFVHKTVHSLLREVTGSSNDLPPPSAPLSLVSDADRARLPAEIEDAYPLAALQLGMCVHHSLSGASGVYHDIFCHDISAPFELSALQQAVAELVAVHPILRTRFALTGFSEPLQLVERETPISLGVSDLSQLSASAQQQALDQFCAEELERGFDVTRAPLLRLHVHRRSAATFCLVVSFHHAILDGWSNARLLAELLRRYLGCLKLTEAVNDASSGRPYREFIALERAVSQRTADRSYWEQRIAALTIGQLPRWPITPADQTPRSLLGGMHELSLSQTVALGLQKLAREAGAPLRSVLLAAHMRILAGLCNEAEVSTGLVVNGRLEAEGGDRTLGLFLNTVPFSLRIQDESWRALVQKAFRAECELLPYRRFPLSEIQKLAGGRPLFEVGFNFVHFHIYKDVAELGHLRLMGSRVYEQHNYTLAAIFGLDPLTEQLSLHLVYDPKVLGATQVAEIARCYERVLAALVADPAASCLSAPLLSDAQRTRILTDWNQPPTEAPDSERFQPAHTLFEAQAARTPAACALRWAREGATELGAQPLQMTYRELDERAQHFAARLQAQGVGPERVVGVFLERGPDLIISFLAILKAGGAYLPLDPSYPHERLAYMLKDAQPLVILTHSALLPQLPQSVASVILIDPLDAQSSPQDATVLASAIDADTLAYVIYTSGSSGRPRGVLVTHRGLPNLAQAQIRTFAVTAHSRVLQLASSSFDASISEFLMALCSGAALHLVERVSTRSPAELVELLRTQAITHVTIPPSLLAILPPADLPALTSIIVAGEACPPAVAARWLPGRRLLNAYGPTEVTVCATIAEVTQADTQATSLHIGTPMEGMQVYILDAQGALAPIGTKGELCCAGVGVARGYLNQPERTAQKFVSNPFGPGVLYRTGDIASFRPDGRIDIWGRIDDQIKLRGFRIELDEIRAVLSEHPEVRDSAVITRQGADGDKHLVGYVSRRPSPPAADVELWPSTFELSSFDDLLYHSMAADEKRIAAYRSAIEQAVPGKIVVEIGTGATAVLAILCARAGARKIYALEIDPIAAQKAQQRVADLGLAGSIEVLCADARHAVLPEPADVCVSAVVGSIGGSEGAAAILNAAQHLLRPGGIMIPHRSLSQIAAVALPDALRDAPRFSDLARFYVGRIFEKAGYPFDPRLCIKGLARDSLVSSADVFEDLDFSSVVPLSDEHEIHLAIERTGCIDGFLVWLNLTLGTGVTIDILDGGYSSLPVYLPVFDRGVTVAPGDVIHAKVQRQVSEDGLHPDFFVQGRLIRQDGSDLAFAHASYHHNRSHSASAFHRRLLQSEEVQRSAHTGEPPGSVSRSVSPPRPAQDLRAFLKQRLPDYMIPSSIIELDELPRTANGKLDRRALPDPSQVMVGPRDAGAPLSQLEQEIAAIWREVLEVATVGLHDNFFDLGGHSVLLMLVLGKLQERRGDSLTMLDLFEHPTVSSLAAFLESRSHEPARRVAPANELPQSTRDKRLAAREQRRQARQNNRS